MDWASVFDEKYPHTGASDAVLAELMSDIARPISAAEIRQINSSQQNPFPKGDLLHRSWQPFNAAAWVVRWSDGGEFRTGERWFQFFPALDPGHGVRAMLLAYHLPQYMPGAVPIGFNGGGTFYMLDLRRPAVAGEYPVVCAHAGYLAWKPEACRIVADSLVAACQGTINVDDLR